jgi:hypothetical protein
MTISTIALDSTKIGQIGTVTDGYITAFTAIQLPKYTPVTTFDPVTPANNVSPWLTIGGDNDPPYARLWNIDTNTTPFYPGGLAGAYKLLAGVSYKFNGKLMLYSCPPNSQFSIDVSDVPVP